MITSKSNAQIKRVNSLKEKKYRLEYCEYIVEGYKQIREAVSAGKEIINIYYSPKYTGELTQNEKAIAVSEEVFEKLSEEVTPQGVLAVLKIQKNTPKKPSGKVLLLDGISDPGNLGTIIRTANAAGYTDIYLKNCTDAYSPKCVRSAMSGIFFVNVYLVDENDVASLFCDFPMICADMKGENLYSFNAPSQFCLVIGNEANGVSEKIKKSCEYTVRIPMRDTCESLNAGVSAAIMMYHLKYCNKN